MRAVVLNLLGLCMVGAFGPAFSMAGSPNCGCDQPTCSVCNPVSSGGHCHHHHGCRKHRGCCCCEQPGGGSRSGQPRLAEIPSGPIVDSMPMMRAMPAMMAMPMMPMMFGQVPQSTRAVSFEEPRSNSRSRAPERTCEDSHDRIDELDARVEALNLRMKTIQRSVELQTKILEDLRDSGMIGGKKIGG